MANVTRTAQIGNELEEAAKANEKAEEDADTLRRHSSTNVMSVNQIMKAQINRQPTRQLTRHKSSFAKPMVASSEDSNVGARLKALEDQIKMLTVCIDKALGKKVTADRAKATMSSSL